MSAQLKDVFGDAFAEATETKPTRRSILKLDDELKIQISKFAKENLKPGTIELPYTHNGLIYHILLAKTPQEIRRKTAKYGQDSVAFRWGTTWLYTYIKLEDSNRLQENTYYLLIGWKKKPAESGGSVFHNMRVDGILTLDEIQRYTDKIDEVNATNEALAEHKVEEKPSTENTEKTEKENVEVEIKELNSEDQGAKSE